MITAKETRATRFSIRATAKQKELISRAAASRKQSISEFVIENSLEAAEGLALDNANIVLSPENYRKFVAALDEPPRTSAALKRLFSDPSLLDDPIS
ncbi:hypothetical protein BH10ACI3_BH10ACI3_29420 [soil metagenome]